MSEVGKNRPHDSARGHVSGESIYIDDMPKLPNELIVDFFYPKVAHARVKSLDLSAARNVPGVAALYTYKDLEGHNRLGPIVQDEPLLAENLIEFMGQPLVVIAAENRLAIRQAKAAIKLELEVLEPTLTIDQAKAKDFYLSPTRRVKRGDPEAVFAKCDHVLEGVFECAGQEQFYLESQAAVVHPGENDQLVVYSSTQHPTEVQEVCAHLNGLSMHQVVCVTKRLGGGFGGKESQAAHPAAMAALVSHKLKRPTRIIYNKDDDMQATGKRHPFKNEYKVGFDKDGRILALQAHLYSDGGAYADLSPPVMSRAMTHIDNAYWLPDVDVKGTVCKTHLSPNTAFRGFGGPQGVATIENIMDVIAAYLKKDALAVRRLNLYGKDERNVTPYHQVFYDNNLPEIFDGLEASSEYAERRKAVEQFNAGSKTHLKGLSLTPVKFGISFNTKFLNQANALVNIYLDGTIQVSTGAVEMGQGVNTNIRQLVAGQFDIPSEDVIVMATSTEKNNNTSATAASSATDLNGSAAVNACQAIKERLAVVAAEHLAAQHADMQPSPTTIVFENGQVYDYRRPNTKITFKQLVRFAYLNRVTLGERGSYATRGLDWSPETGPDKVMSGNPFLYFTQGAAVAEVTIDRFTGEVKTDRVDILMDIGAPINPGIARGQLTGAFIQGMGWVTTEDLRYSDDGTLLSHSPTTYKIPNIQDTPPVFNVDWLDKPNALNVGGSKAVGEPPLLLGLCVWSAIYNALTFVSGGAVPELKLPATCEEILLRLTHYENPGGNGGRVREDAEFLAKGKEGKVVV